MAHQTKIATCCYCSSRTILKPSARHGHELACGSCGAPLHNMKWLKSPSATQKAVSNPKATSRPAAFAMAQPTMTKPKKTKKRKHRKPLWRRGLEEAWDIIEDIFD